MHVPPPPAVQPDDIDGRSMARRGPALHLAHPLLFPRNARDAENDAVR